MKTLKYILCHRNTSTTNISDNTANTNNTTTQPTMQLTFPQRREIAQTTVTETPDIITTYSAHGATTNSTFYSTVPALPPTPPTFTSPRQTRVLASDTFAAVRELIHKHGAAPSKTAVLNLASDLAPGGYWLRTLCETQEEALCYSSTLFTTLDPKHYPWPNTAASGIFSPGVVVHRDTISNGCELMPAEEVVVVGVITVAAPRYPRRSRDQKQFFYAEAEEEMREKVRAVYRMAALNGRTNLVLGAMGCGAYACPKEGVAGLMKDVLLEDEFVGWFERVWWAVYDPLEDGNCGVFGSVCGGVSIR